MPDTARVAVIRPAPVVKLNRVATGASFIAQHCIGCVGIGRYFAIRSFLTQPSPDAPWTCRKPSFSTPR